MAKKTKKQQVVASRLMAIVVLLSACAVVLFMLGGQNKLKNVEIECVNGTLDQTQKDEIIRSSTLKMGAQIGSLADIEQSIIAGVNSTGFARYEGAERISNGTMKLIVSIREPVAVLSLGGNYIVIDEDGMVIDISKTMPYGKGICVSGAEASTYSKGKTLVTRKENQLKEIIRIASAIHKSGFESTYSELNVKDVKDMYLITNNNMYVEIFDGKNIEQTLLMVEEIIKSGVNKGKITISGDYAGLRQEN
ncbi:MAG: hypothetical protein IJN21_06870 [Clostridia bacterium]|nr:hypothetical protein [Clostridia bacterium]